MTISVPVEVILFAILLYFFIFWTLYFTSLIAMPRDREHELQKNCVTWFGYEYPEHRHVLFAVPNGGHRHRNTAKKLKAEGVKAGVADLLFLQPSGGYHGLCIEMKVKPNRQSPPQKEFESQVIKRGYQYALCHSFDEFRHTITKYLANGQNRNQKATSQEPSS